MICLKIAVLDIVDLYSQDLVTLQISWERPQTVPPTPASSHSSGRCGTTLL
ncbi:hypothetical protein CCP3SC1_240026 [Gammaproteobacteria bacterium]